MQRVRGDFPILRRQVHDKPLVYLDNGATAQKPQAVIDATLRALSPYALRQVAPLDPETGEVGTTALISFGIRAQSLEDQQELVDRVRGEIGTPPAGVRSSTGWLCGGPAGPKTSRRWSRSSPRRWLATSPHR